MKLTRIIIYTNVSQTFFLADPFWFRKITTDLHILAHVDTEFSGDRYTKLNMCISELILDRSEYIPVVCITLHCVV